MMGNRERRPGLVHLYVGDGKGKTTAAVGLSVRCAGCGGRVLFCQFLKGRPTGELAPLESLGVWVLRAPGVSGFVSAMDKEALELCKKGHRDCLSQIRLAVNSGSYDLVVLDEAVDAVNTGLLPPEQVIELIQKRPAHTEMVLTGRNPPDSLVEASDYLTHFTCVKHPYQKGIPARPGIEY